MAARLDPSIYIAKPQRLNKREIYAAWEALNAKEPGAKDRLALAFQPLASIVVKQYLKDTTGSPALFLFDDLCGVVRVAQYAALCSLADKIANGTFKPLRETITAYMDRVATNAMIRHILESRIVGPGASTIFRSQKELTESEKIDDALEKMRDDEPPKNEESNDFSTDEEVESAADNTGHFSMGVDDSLKLYDPQAGRDLLEMVKSCCRTDEERQIVDLRLEDKTDEEIGEILGRDKSTIYRIRKRIEFRYNELAQAA